MNRYIFIACSLWLTLWASVCVWCDDVLSATHAMSLTRNEWKTFELLISITWKSDHIFWYTKMVSGCICDCTSERPHRSLATRHHHFCTTFKSCVATTTRLQFVLGSILSFVCPLSWKWDSTVHFFYSGFLLKTNSERKCVAISFCLVLFRVCDAKIISLFIIIRNNFVLRRASPCRPHNEQTLCRTSLHFWRWSTLWNICDIPRHHRHRRHCHCRSNHKLETRFAFGKLTMQKRKLKNTF